MTASNTYGRQVVVPLTNKSGGGVIAGDVVVVDSTNNDAFTTTTSASSTLTIGIAQETIASNAVGRVLLSGYAPLVNVNASVTRGHYGATHTVAKQATDAGATRGAGTFCVFLTGGTTPDAVVYPSDLSAAALTNPMSAKGQLIQGDTGGTPVALAVGNAAEVLTSGGAGAFNTWAAAPNMAGVAFHPQGWPRSATTGTWAMNSGTDVTGFLGGYYFQNSSFAQNDAISFDLWMAAGTYTFFAYYRRSTNTGIITLKLDGASQGTIDTYNGSADFSTGTITGIVVTSGLRTWQLIVATKNASSSGYILELFEIGWTRTA